MIGVGHTLFGCQDDALQVRREHDAETQEGHRQSENDQALMKLDSLSRVFT